LRYDEVYRVKKENPGLHIEINGEIKSVDEIDEHLKYTDSVMMGREIYDNPMILTEFGKYYGKDINITREEIIETFIHCVPYIGFPKVLNAVFVAKAIFADSGA